MNEAAYRAAERRLWRSIGVEPTERSVHLGHNDVDVRIQELGAGPPVVFIHGVNTSGASWASLAARMRGFRCIVLDRPGTGLSQPLRRPIDAAALADVADTLVIDVLDALDLSSASLVATSFGGYFALRAAAAAPARIERLVEFSWPVGTPGTLPWHLRLMSLPGMSRAMAAMPANRRAVRMFYRRMGHGAKLEDGRITAADIDCYLALLRHTDTMRNELAPARALISPLRGLGRLDLSDELLGRIACPTLLIWGGRDLFGGAPYAARLVARIPNAELELLPEAGHSPWLDDLAHSVASVTAFLRRGAAASRQPSVADGYQETVLAS